MAIKIIAPRTCACRSAPQCHVCVRESERERERERFKNLGAHVPACAPHPCVCVCVCVDACACVRAMCVFMCMYVHVGHGTWKAVLRVAIRIRVLRPSKRVPNAGSDPYAITIPCQRQLGAGNLTNPEQNPKP